MPCSQGVSNRQHRRGLDVAVSQALLDGVADLLFNLLDKGSWACRGPVKLIINVERQSIGRSDGRIAKCAKNFRFCCEGREFVRAVTSPPGSVNF